MKTIALAVGALLCASAAHAQAPPAAPSNCAPLLEAMTFAAEMGESPSFMAKVENESAKSVYLITTAENGYWSLWQVDKTTACLLLTGTEWAPVDELINKPPKPDPAPQFWQMPGVRGEYMLEAAL